MDEKQDTENAPVDPEKALTIVVFGASGAYLVIIPNQEPKLLLKVLRLFHIRIYNCKSILAGPYGWQQRGLASYIYILLISVAVLNWTAVILEFTFLLEPAALRNISHIISYR